MDHFINTFLIVNNLDHFRNSLDIVIVVDINYITIIMQIHPIAIGIVITNMDIDDFHLQRNFDIILPNTIRNFN